MPRWRSLASVILEIAPKKKNPCIRLVELNNRVNQFETNREVGPGEHGVFRAAACFQICICLAMIDCVKLIYDFYRRCDTNSRPARARDTEVPKLPNFMPLFRCMLPLCKAYAIPTRRPLILLAAARTLCCRLASVQLFCRHRRPSLEAPF